MYMGFDPEKITFFAKTDARGAQVPFGIKAKDRQRHMYIVGKTGMGKSTLLENMAAQDIAGGEGVAFIDPHGSAAEVLLDYVPEHRLNDVVYFAPFDVANPISFNVMEDVEPDKRHLVVSGLCQRLKRSGLTPGVRGWNTSSLMRSWLLLNILIRPSSRSIAYFRTRLTVIGWSTILKTLR
jgi:hypothetical protein